MCHHSGALLGCSLLLLRLHTPPGSTATFGAHPCPAHPLLLLLLLLPPVPTTPACLQTKQETLKLCKGAGRCLSILDNKAPLCNKMLTQYP
jgi:hypothetical protein